MICFQIVFYYCCIAEIFSLLIQDQAKKKEYLTNFEPVFGSVTQKLLLLVT
jgi:hypothetical protein